MSKAELKEDRMRLKLAAAWTLRDPDATPSQKALARSVLTRPAKMSTQES